MHLYLVLGLIVALLGMVFISWVRRTPFSTAKPILNRILLILGAGILLFLALRTHWSVLGLAGIPLIQRLLQFYLKAKSTSGPTPGQISEVETEFIQMSIEHDSGQMSGTVLKGTFAGQKIELMELAKLEQLLQECQSDPQSVSVLEAFLDRTFNQRDRSTNSKEAFSSTGMTYEEALEVLNLSASATKKEIIEAHKRLMQRIHPDRGGSSYLAAQINCAKDVLLKQQGHS